MKISTRDDAEMLRDVLLPFWAEYYATNGQPGTIASTNMCCLTASMVAEVDSDWVVVHGEVDGNAHAWCRRADGTVLDLTGDQFGRDPVVWGALPVGYAPDADEQQDCVEHYDCNDVTEPMLPRYAKARKALEGER